MDKNAKRSQGAAPKATAAAPKNKPSFGIGASHLQRKPQTGGDTTTPSKPTVGFKNKQQQQQPPQQQRTGGALSTPSTSETSTPNTSTQAPEKVKKPKPPKPPVDLNEHITQRAYVGGLARDVTTSDLEGRFKSFGQLKDAYVAKDVEGLCRGFGYITLDTTRKEWLKCLALFNGAKWKGNVMKIEEANKAWTVRRQEEQENFALQEKKKEEALIKKKKRDPIKHAEDMSPVTYKNMEGRRGWKRGRYGQPVLTMRLDKFTYDPSHYKNNVERLYNQPSHPPLPIHKLLYQIDENEPIPKPKHFPSEVVLAPFLERINQRKNKAAAQPEPMEIEVTKSTTSKTSKSKSGGSDEDDDEESGSDDDMDGLDSTNVNNNTSADRDVMASILAGMDFSPKATRALDDSDLDDSDLEGVYSEDLGGAAPGVSSLLETTAEDMFGDLPPLVPSTEKKVSKADRESRPEDLFGADDEDEEDENRPSLDFLEAEEEEEDEGEEDEEEEDEDEDEEEDEEGISEDVAREIAQLQSSTSTTSGGLFDSDDEGSGALKSAAELKAEESEQARLKAIESRQAALAEAREKQRQLIAGSLAQMDSRNKKQGHVVFADSDEDSEDYEKMERDHEARMAASSGSAKSIFDSDSEEESTSKPTKIDKSRLDIFGSEDEDEGDNDTLGGENAFGIKEQFEGPAGRALFKMQTRIGTGDSRFQLTKDFLDDTMQDDEEDYEAHRDMMQMKEDVTSYNKDDIVMDEDQQLKSNVQAEKNQALSVLRAMFGDEVVHNKKKEEDAARKRMGGSGAVHGLITRFDPTAAPAPAPAPAVASESESEDEANEVRNAKYHSDEEEEEEDDREGDEEQDHEADKDHDGDASAKKSVGFSFGFNFGGDDDEDNTAAAPAAASSTGDDNTPRFQVASDLKSLFAPASGTFKLFGGDDEEDESEGDSDKENNEDLSGVGHEELKAVTVGSKTIFTDEKEAQAVQQQLSHSGNLFFFHFQHPYLFKRSPFRPQQTKVFMRTGTLEEVTANWEKTRQTLTQEYKRKHRSAARNRERAAKRVKTNPASSAGQE
ncbi:hypothetical protein BGW42_007983 [Actinomortierella wolfii]|nr:hypothetical protein BGW42_007983 [Actinomortierella wolfii]